MVSPVDPTEHRKGMSLGFDYATFGLVDAVYFLVVVLFGIGNGFLCTSLLMHAPSVCAKTQEHFHHVAPGSDDSSNGLDTMETGSLSAHTENQAAILKEREVCGAIMGLFLNTGLVIGSLLSFLWRLIV
jgi:hypothetical protein